MVVVPTSRHVTMHYGYTPVDAFGWLLTLAGLALVITLARRAPVAFPVPRRATGPATEAEGSPGADGSPGAPPDPARPPVAVPDRGS
jgi:hypothetical protein